MWRAQRFRRLDELNCRGQKQSNQKQHERDNHEKLNQCDAQTTPRHAAPPALSLYMTGCEGGNFFTEEVILTWREQSPKIRYRALFTAKCAKIAKNQFGEEVMSCFHDLHQCRVLQSVRLFLLSPSRSSRASR
jgi:hypothetical protein